MKKRDTLNNIYSCRTNDNTIMESFQEIFGFLIEYFKKTGQNPFNYGIMLSLCDIMNK